MALIFELDENYYNWLESRPEQIKNLCEKYPPNKLYKLGNHKVFIYSYHEDNTVTIAVSAKYNLILFERKVFGINPDDLIECNLPDENEPLGVILNQEQAKDHINKMSQIIRRKS